MRGEFTVSINKIPISWARQRGVKGAWKAPQVTAWQEEVRDIVQQEASRQKIPWLPYRGPMHVHTEVTFESLAELENSSQDGDNIEKAIFDALNGVIWPDDRVRFIRSHHFLATHTGAEGAVVGPCVTLTVIFL